jgi:hypothetical protein
MGKIIDAFVCWSIGLMMGVMLSIIADSCSNNTYKDGQIDAINGKVYYELRSQEDGTTDWVFISENIVND